MFYLILFNLKNQFQFLSLAVVSECKADQGSTESVEKDKLFGLEPKLAEGCTENNGTPSALLESTIRTVIAIIIILHLVLLRGQLSI